MNSLFARTVRFVFCWLATVASACTPPVNISNRVAPFSPTLFAAPPPSSCVGLPTGLHNITIRGYSVVELWCQSNKAFLVLPRPRATTNDTNYSENDGVRTYFCAVRLDPQTLLVDVGDLTFAQPIPTLPKKPVVFASAAECRGQAGAFSFFNVDLRGTLFQLADDTTVTTFGWMPANSSMISEENKVLNARVYGFCGGSYLGPHTIVGYASTDSPGGGGAEVYCKNLQWRLSLVVTRPDILGAVLAPPCSLPLNLTGNLTCNATLRDSPPPPAVLLCPSLQSQPQPSTTTAVLDEGTTVVIDEGGGGNTTGAVVTTAVLNEDGGGDNGQGNNTGAIVGGVVGAVLMVAVVVILGWFVVRALARGKHQQQEQGQQQQNEEDETSTRDSDDLRANAAQESRTRANNRAAASQYSNRPMSPPNQTSPYGVLSRDEVGTT